MRFAPNRKDLYDFSDLFAIKCISYSIKFEICNQYEVRDKSEIDCVLEQIILNVPQIALL